MKRMTALLAATTLLSVGGWLVAAPAQAAYTASVATGVLTLTGTTGDDAATVLCDVGMVEINDADPSTGAATCASITSVTVQGDAGNDTVYLDGMTAGSFPLLTAQTVNMGDGFDQIVAAPVAGTLNGGINDDRFYPGPGDNTILGSGGIDEVLVLETAGGTVTDSSLVTPDGGTDSLSQIEKARLTGTGANETFDATAFTGATTLEGHYGDDTILGGSGADFAIGGGNQDTLDGNDGDDTLVPNDGDDQINGGLGTDTLLLGDSGTWTVTNSTATGPFIGTDTFGSIELGYFITNGTLDAGAFNHPATVLGSGGADTIITGGANDLVESNAGNDTIRTKGGNDVLRGEEGKDTLNAGGGADVLDGGSQRDTCNGGPGPDSFKHCEVSH